MAQANDNDVIYTREQLLAEAEELARASSLHTSARDAWQQVQAGALEGTIFASRLAQLFFLIDDCEPTSCAAE